ncbi:hypothetical protein [Roseovarius sp. 2305UL8-3]|uniref:hypothetical protein n=1 Tax=Roseovarius conchicola TaxID=3121636 RepID=UPI00352763C0
MMWLIQPLMAWLQTPETANLIFAALSFLAAYGCCPRRCAVLTGLIYLVLVL